MNFVISPLALILGLAVAMSAASAADKAQLGQALFFDASLSQPAGQSCASCHDPARAFSHPEKGNIVALGALPHLVGNRNVPAILYASYSPAFHFDAKESHYVGGQFLDGRAATLEEQAKGPFLNPLEMANPDKKAVVDKVRVAVYGPLFEDVFGKDALRDTETAYARIAEALAEFQRQPQFRPFSSKYDAYLAGRVKLSASELRGLRLFEAESKGNCAACHPSRPGPKGEPPLLTDFTYDNLGVPRNPDLPFYKSGARQNPEGPHFVDRGLGGALGQRDQDGKFKVPTLRNIALTAPYMHNGYFTSLRGVVEFYNDRDVRPLCAGILTSEAEARKRKCWPAPEVITNVNREEMGRLGLSDREIDDIVAFLETLTDGWMIESVH
jgi:cytochrome c peroxidase